MLIVLIIVEVLVIYGEKSKKVLKRIDKGVQSINDKLILGSKINSETLGNLHTNMIYKDSKGSLQK